MTKEVKHIYYKLKKYNKIKLTITIIKCSALEKIKNTSLNIINTLLKICNSYNIYRLTYSIHRLVQCDKACSLALFSALVGSIFKCYIDSG